MRSLVLAAFMSSCVFACSGPADESSNESSSEAALSSRSSRNVTVHYRGELSALDSSYRIEVDVTHPAALRTTETVRGSQIMNDSSYCDVYLESFRGDVALRVLDATGSVIAESSEHTYFNTSRILPDDACPDGLLVGRSPIESLDVETSMKGTSFDVAGKQVQVPFGYGSTGILTLGGKATFEATGRSTYRGHRESDRGSSELTTKGNARIELDERMNVHVGLGFDVLRTVELERVY